MKTAACWHALDPDRVQCDLCPHACRLHEGQDGRCRVRGVREGVLKALGYGHVSSAHVDPIEKKPLYHVCPGQTIFSVGGWGCNFACRFCQNWSISQTFLCEHEACSPDDIAAAALRVDETGSAPVGVAYTYNEPLVGFEFVRDCAARVRAQGGINVLVTNGYLNPGPAAQLLPLIDALNIDVKSMDPTFYREQCNARLAPVLAFAEQAVSAGCHVEVTHLVIPGLNDHDEEFRKLSTWIRDTLGPLTPLHLTAYRPEFEMQRPATPTDGLRRARERCMEALAYVYLGNIPGSEGQATHCPQCGNLLVMRAGYRVRVVGMANARCVTCDRPVDLRC